MTYLQPLTGCNNNGSNNPYCERKNRGGMIKIPCHF